MGGCAKTASCDFVPCGEIEDIAIQRAMRRGDSREQGGAGALRNAGGGTPGDGRHVSG